MLHLFRAAKPPAAPDLVAPLTVAGRVVPVVVRRSARARRSLLRADATRGVLAVSLPRRARADAAAALIAGHRDWIAAQVARWPVPRPFAEGRALPFGDGVLTPRRRPGATVRDGAVLWVGGDAAALPGRVRRWLRGAALALLTAETRDFAARAGRPVASVRVGDPRGRWGSCASGGRIAYSWRLVLMPAAVRRGIVAHEVAHLVHPNHGAGFHALAAELTEGDVAANRRWLRAHGAALHWVGRDA